MNSNDEVHIVMSICSGELEGIEDIFWEKEDAENYIKENQPKSIAHLYIETHVVKNKGGMRLAKRNG